MHRNIPHKTPIDVSEDVDPRHETGNLRGMRKEFRNWHQELLC